MKTTKTQKTRRLKFRAFCAMGLTHGGGGLELGEWRSTYNAAKRDLKIIGRHPYGDSFFGVDVMR